MNRTNQILAIVLAVQIALGVVVFWPWSVVSGVGSGPLFADLKAADVVELVVSDTQGNHVALSRHDADWVLPEAGDYPANGDKISTLLETIEGLQTDRLLTKTDASHKRLQVAEDDFNYLAELKSQDGSSRKLYIGSSAGGDTAHVRADGSSEVYLASGLEVWGISGRAVSWIDTLYFTVPQTATIALTLENKNGVFEFERDGENWTMKGLADDETFNEDSLTNLLSQVVSLHMMEPIGKEEEASFGLDDPQAIITLKTEEKTYTLRFGAKNEENQSYVLKSSESPYYVLVDEYRGDEFAGKTRDDFLELPPTPQADTGG
jgi:hypothetical protein